MSVQKMLSRNKYIRPKYLFLYITFVIFSCYILQYRRHMSVPTLPRSYLNIVGGSGENLHSQFYVTKKVNKSAHKMDIDLTDSNSIQKPLKRILIWTKYFGEDPLNAVGHYRNIQLSQCHIECEFTSDTRLLSWSDAVVFHSRDIDRHNLPPFHAHDQIWVYLQQESPSNTRRSLEDFSSFFNWTMTYRHDSDVVHPYGLIVPLSPNSNPSRPTSPLPLQGLQDLQLPPPQTPSSSPTSNYAQIYSKKTKLVAWVVSNCYTQSKREDFVSDLQQYISIDIYGHCGPHSCPSDCLKKIGEDYKFFLSFENSLCSDYATEKLFQALKLNLVPVVYGFVNYEKIAPLNSYIDARDFNSSKQLGDYLTFLGENEEEYLKYFWWKDKYTVQSGDGWCNLCDKISKDRTEFKWYSDLKSWWNFVEDSKLGMMPACLKSFNFLKDENFFDKIVRNFNKISRYLG